MRRRFSAILCIAAILLGLVGCQSSLRHAVENSNGPALPSVDLHSTLIAQVTDVNAGCCTIIVLEGNSTYDSDSILYLTCNTALSRGDVISLEYRYLTDVSALNGTPHITVETATILPTYTPPETTGTQNT